jgi:hypothetical protein
MSCRLIRAPGRLGRRSELRLHLFDVINACYNSVLIFRSLTAIVVVGVGASTVGWSMRLPPPTSSVGVGASTVR